MRPPRVAVLTGEGPGAVAVVRVWGEGRWPSPTPPSARIAGAAWRRPRRVGPASAGSGPGSGTRSSRSSCPASRPRSRSRATAGRRRSRWSSRPWSRPARSGRGPRRGSATRAARSLRAEATLDLPRAATLRAAAHLLDQANGALDRRAVLDTRGDRRRAGAATRSTRCTDRRGPTVGVRLVTGLAGGPGGSAERGEEPPAQRPARATTGRSSTRRRGRPATSSPSGRPSTAGPSSWPTRPASATRTTRSRPRASRGPGPHQRAADLVLLVLDRSEPLTDEDHRLMAEHPAALVVANKADLPAVWDSDGPRRLGRAGRRDRAARGRDRPSARARPAPGRLGDPVPGPARSGGSG